MRANYYRVIRVLLFPLAFAIAILVNVPLEAAKVALWGDEKIKKECEIFKNKPFEYLNKDRYQKNICQILDFLRHKKPKQFKKICFDDKSRKGETFLIKTGRLFLWEVGIFLAKNAPRDASQKLEVNLDARDKKGNTALHYFCAIPSVSNNTFGKIKPNSPKICQEALDAGIPQFNENLRSHCKNRNEQYKAECRKANYDHAGECEGETTFWATLSKSAIALIGAGASLTIKNKKKEAPIHVSAKYGNIHIFNYLKKKKGFTKKLVNLPDGKNNTPYSLYLYRRTTCCHCRGTIDKDELIKCFTDLNRNLPNKLGKKPTDLYGNYPIEAAKVALWGDDNIEKETEIFVKNPFKYLKKDRYQKNLCQILDRLRKKKPKIFKKICFEDKNEKGETFLIKTGRLFLWKVGSFLAKNAPRDASQKLEVNLDARDNKGNTALHYFCAIPSVSNNSFGEIKPNSPKIYQEALDAGIPQFGGNLRSRCKNRNEQYKKECCKAKYLDEVENEGEMSFWESLSNPAIALIGAGASLTIKNKKKEAPIHVSAKYGNIYIFNYLKEEKRFTEKLVNLSDFNNNTTYMLYLYRLSTWSPKRGTIDKEELVKVFTDLDKNIPNKLGKKPKDLIPDYMYTVEKTAQSTSTFQRYWKPCVVVVACAALLLCYRFFKRTPQPIVR